MEGKKKVGKEQKMYVFFCVFVGGKCTETIQLFGENRKVICEKIISPFTDVFQKVINQQINSAINLF